MDFVLSAFEIKPKGMSRLFDSGVYHERRQELMNHLPDAFIILPANDFTPKNYSDNTFHFRQDGTFLYYGGHDLPGMVVVIDSAAGQTSLYGREITLDDVVWTGPQPTLTELGDVIGVEKTHPLTDLQQTIDQAKKEGRKIHYLPPYQGSTKIRLTQWLGFSLDEVDAHYSRELVGAVVKQRSIKKDIELKEIEEALAITKDMHLEVIYESRKDVSEADLLGRIMNIVCRAGVDTAYPPILTKNGHVLHNHERHHILPKGGMVLGDFGAESTKYYASDITRTVPVDSVFSTKQKEIYSIVLQALEASAAALKPGISFLEVHLIAAHTMARGLKDLGLMKGDIEEAVKEGAHALFFVHGLGHMMGLDVHDMEGLGEEAVGYGSKFKRSKQFGLKALRLARNLEPGFVFTIEPGIYFIPALIDQWEAEKKFESFINYGQLKAYRDFTGVRIEDNYVLTSEGARLLGPPIPKEIHEIEFLKQSQLDLKDRIA